MALKKFIFLLFPATACFFSTAQTDSSGQPGCGIRISLLTCTPGKELYSSFGHSALRVTDSINNHDLVFNYGTFDFFDPDFYSKFVRGKLLYFVSIDSLNGFLSEYDYYKRGVTEQAFNISCEEKQKLVVALFENAKEENKYYQYDFNYDNCTTRLRDMLEKAAGKQLETKNIVPEPGRTTFRHLIHRYLDNGGQQWSKFGIDLLLGSPIDKKINNREAMFLPDYLMIAFDSSSLNGKRVVSEKKVLLDYFDAYKTKSGITPLVVFGILFLAITILSFLSRSHWSLFFKVFDFFFFFTVGAIGVVIMFMWFGTEHAMCTNNFNLLWALPTHLPVAFMLFNKKNWINVYFRFIFFYTIALLLAWFFLPQQFNTAFLFVVGIILIRSFYLSKRIAPEAQKHRFYSS
ncbi:MAG TPA: DUF4105 domain-containing protein [Chitinophagaceae bacterium]|nr:DUF4105 domain-containing protein [Chitinophagaceae bacterium]